MKIIILILIFTIVILLYFLFSNMYELYQKKHPQQKDQMEFFNTYERKYDHVKEPLKDKMENLEDSFPSCLKFFGFSDFPTEQELKTRYREIVKKCHPDKGGSPEEFEKVTKAYDEALRIIKN